MTDVTEPDPDNVIPASEMERRRRVLSCVEELADLCKDATERVLELHDMHVPAEDWVPLLVQYAPESIQGLYLRYGRFATGFLDGFISSLRAGAKTGVDGVIAALADRASRGPAIANAPIVVDEVYEPLTWEGERMKTLIDRLLSDAPKLNDDPAQTPAIECVVMLKAGGQIQGALSTTPEGTLRMMAPNQIGQKPVMVEHFFDYEQVADIAVFREVKVSEGPRIIIGS